MRIDPDRRDFRVTAGAAAVNPNELAIQSRSVLRILQELSVAVDVPADHQARGFAFPLDCEPSTVPPAFHVWSGCKKPCDTFVAVCYKNRWFWIEESDIASKRTMLSLMILLALMDTGTKENLPVITIQAN